jgi:DNA anti-recombination protein RmuC
MTDEQLQSLFAGMERQLDRRADEIEQRLRDHVTAVESRLRAEIRAVGEHVETTLLTEFHKWASPAEARSRTISAALRAIDLEMEALNDRVSKLEGGEKPQ